MMIDDKDGSGKLLVMIGALLGFGWMFNGVVAWLNRDGYSQGYTAVLVVAGTLITLLCALPLIGVRATLQILTLFTASGTPMILGSMQRYAQARREFENWRRHDN